MQRTDTSISQARASVETPLKRGKACLTCRFLKIKCDGRKPVCGPCLRHPKEDSCEYTDGPGRSRHRALEETISKLEARIQELENPSIATPSVALHHPYGSPSRRKRTVSPLAPLRAEGSGIMSRTPSSSTYKSIASPTNASESGALTEEYPPALVQSLIDTFLPHSSRFGLFLDPEDLRDASDATPGSTSRTPAVVIHAICLWGAHLSPADSSQRTYEASLLLTSLRSAATHLSTHGHHSRQYLNFIQAKILLAHYFYRIGKPLEARMHADAAGSLVLSSGMHCTRAATEASVEALRRASLSPPAEDAEEIGTMINGFWTTYVTIRHMALASAPSFMTVFDAPSIQVDTPWPMDWESYREGKLPNWGLAPIQAFLRNTIPGERNAQLDSRLTRITKATIILHQATFLANQQDATTELYASNYHLVYRLINEYRRSLPSYAMLSADEAYAVYLCRSLIDGAEIRLCERYRLDENVRHARVVAAKAIFAVDAGFSLDTLGNVTPLLGDLWQSACIVLMEEYTQLQSDYDISNRSIDAINALNAGMATIRMYATDNNVHMNEVLTEVTKRWPWNTPPMTGRPALELVTDVPVASSSTSHPHSIPVPPHFQPLSVAPTKSEDSDTTSVYATPIDFPHTHPHYYHHPAH